MSIISDQLTSCMRTLSSSALDRCRPLGFGVTDWIAIFTFLGAATSSVFIIIRWMWSYCILRKEGKFRTFWGMKKALRPLVRDNARIFLEFGPNSAASSDRPLHTDLSVWYETRDRIVHNNSMIAKIVLDNASRIPRRHRQLFERWLSHIDAFAAHIANPNVDYRHHTFPRDVTKVLGCE